MVTITDMESIDPSAKSGSEQPSDSNHQSVKNETSQTNSDNCTKAITNESSLKQDQGDGEQPDMTKQQSDSNQQAEEAKTETSPAEVESNENISTSSGIKRSLDQEEVDVEQAETAKRLRPSSDSPQVDATAQENDDNPSNGVVKTDTGPNNENPEEPTVVSSESQDVANQQSEGIPNDVEMKDEKETRPDSVALEKSPKVETDDASPETETEKEKSDSKSKRKHSRSSHRRHDKHDKRKSDEALPKADSTFHMKLLLSNNHAGCVIGKGGKTVHGIQQETGVSIKFSQPREYFPGTSERVGYLDGKPERILHALKLIIKRVFEEPSDGQDRGCGIDGVTTVRLSIPSQSASCVIGHKGDNIYAISKSSGARVHIDDAEPNVAERLTNITGKYNQVLRACREIFKSMLQNNDLGVYENPLTRYDVPRSRGRSDRDRDRGRRRSPRAGGDRDRRRAGRSRDRERDRMPPGGFAPPTSRYAPSAAGALQSRYAPLVSPTSRYASDQSRYAPSNMPPESRYASDQPRYPQSSMPPEPQYSDQSRYAPSNMPPESRYASDQSRYAPSNMSPESRYASDQSRYAPSNMSPESRYASDQSRYAPTNSQPESRYASDQSRYAPSNMPPESRYASDQSRYAPTNSQPESRYASDQSRYAPSNMSSESRYASDQSRYAPTNSQPDSRYASDQSRYAPTNSQPESLYASDQSRYAQPDSRYAPDQSRYGQQSSQNHQDSVMTVAVPDAQIGMVLGKRGETLRVIEQQSRTRIQLSPKGSFVPGTTNRVVTITGRSQQDCDQAQALIANQLAIGLQQQQQQQYQPMSRNIYKNKYG